MTARTPKAPPKSALAKGVERRPNGYRFRHRQPHAEGAVIKYKVHFVNYPCLDEATCRRAELPPNDPRWPANALAEANEYSRTYHRDKDMPRTTDTTRAISGTLREWLERYRDEALIGHRCGQTDVPPPFKTDPQSEAGKAHDIGQINTLLRMGGFVIPGEEEHRAENPRAAKMLDRHRPTFSPEIRDVLNTDVVRLGKSHFKLIADKWSKGAASPSTKRRLKTNLSACLNYHAVNYEMDLPQEWLRVPILNDGRKPKARALTEAEWATIKKTIDAMDLHPSVKACILFIRWTGVRRGEACKLRWENITWPTVRDAVPMALLERTKSKRGAYKERSVPLPDNAVDALRALVQNQGAKPKPWPKSGWVFPAPKLPDTPVAGQTIWQAFVRVFGAQQRPGATTKSSSIGVKRAAPHHLRHTRATELSVTMGEQQMMELFGWSNRDMVDRYRHMAEKLGLLVRDADNKLRSATDLKNSDDFLKFFEMLPKRHREQLMAQMAVTMAQDVRKPATRKNPAAQRRRG